MVGRCSTSPRSSNTRREMGVSETLEILFLMSMTSILLGIVLYSYYGLVNDIKEESRYATLQNIAGKILSDIHSVQSLTIYPGNIEIKKRLEIPEYVGGSQYEITLRGDYLIVRQGSYEIKMPVSSRISLKNSTAASINAYLVYNLTSNTLEVKNE